MTAAAFALGFVAGAGFVSALLLVGLHMAARKDGGRYD